MSSSNTEITSDHDTAKKEMKATTTLARLISSVALDNGHHRVAFQASAWELDVDSINEAFEEEDPALRRKLISKLWNTNDDSVAATQIRLKLARNRMTGTTTPDTLFAGNPPATDRDSNNLLVALAQAAVYDFEEIYDFAKASGSLDCSQSSAEPTVESTAEPTVEPTAESTAERSNNAE